VCHTNIPKGLDGKPRWPTALHPEIPLADLVSMARSSGLFILAARVEKVLALHERQGMMTAYSVRCINCGEDWPCPTVRLLDGEE
jgi:hypothetical protein